MQGVRLSSVEWVIDVVPNNRLRVGPPSLELRIWEFDNAATRVEPPAILLILNKAR